MSKGVGDEHGSWAHYIYTAYPRRAENALPSALREKLDAARSRTTADKLRGSNSTEAAMLRTTEFFSLQDDPPVALEALVTHVNSGAPGRPTEDYVQVGFRMSGERVDPISGDPYRYVARLQIDVAKKLYRELGEMIDHARGAEIVT